MLDYLVLYQDKPKFKEEKGRASFLMNIKTYLIKGKTSGIT